MTLRFGVFELDLRAGELRKHGLRTKLQEQPFRILAMLLERPGELVTRDELRRQLWPAHTYVDFDRSLNKAVNKLRLALGDSAENPRFVETVPRHGYRFIAPTEADVSGPHGLSRSNGPPEPAPVPPALSLATGTGRRRKVWATLAITLTVLLLAALAAPLLQRVLALRAASAIRNPRRSVAVLDFKNLAGRPDDAWLSTAIADWLTTDLAVGEQLRTITQERVAEMRVELALSQSDRLGRDSLARIRKNLGADLVVVGSYASLGPKFGDQIRLDLRLADARNGECLAAISETGTESRLFDLVSRAGATLRAKLGLQPVTAEEAAAAEMALPSSPAATRMYSEGLAKLRLFDALAARDLLRKAVDLEPSSALCHWALASAWAGLGYDENAKGEAKKAFDLSSNLPRAQRLLIEGRYREMSRDWERAIEIYRALFDFFPDNLDYGLALAGAEVSAGKGQNALATLAALQNLPPALRNDPRIDLADGRAAESLGDFKRDLASVLKAAEKARAAGASLLLAQARADQAWALENLGRFDEADAAAREAKQLYSAAGDPRGVARATTTMGIALEDKGDAAGAKRMYEESLAILRQVGNKFGVANDLDDLGDVLLALGDLPGARRAYQESLATQVEIGNQDGVALAKGALGAVLLALGDYSGAKKTCEESVEICRRIGDRSKAAIGLACLGSALRADGNLEEARKYETEAVSLFEETGDKSAAAESELTLAQLLLDRGNGLEAAVTARRAADEFEKDKASKDESLANAVLAQAYLAQGKVADAQSAMERAIAILGKCHNRELELLVEITAARVRAASGHPADRAQAEQSLRQALAEATATGFVNYGLEARLRLGELEISSGDCAKGRARLKALEKDAAERGFGLMAQKATAALKAGAGRDR